MKTQGKHKRNSNRLNALVHAANKHPGLENTAIGAGVLGALVLTLAGIAIMVS